MPTLLPRAGYLPVPMLLLLFVLATTPFWLARVGLYQYLALEVMIWMLFALGYNLMLGTTGLPSFGHGAFFGVGAYAFGLLQQRVFADLWFDLAGAVLVSAALGALVGACVAHKRGIYFALLTIAFGQVMWFVSIKWHAVTGGEDGLQNIARPVLRLGVASLDLRSNEALFYFCFVLFAASLVVLWRLVHSPFGRVLSAIRQNELRAAFVGYHVWLYKWLAITIASAFAGLAGAMFALAQQSAYPNVMSLHSSGFVVMMVLIGGGLVSFWGPAIGAVVFILSRDVLGAATETWLLWYGLLFVVMVLCKPEGVAGLWQQLRQSWRRRAAFRSPAASPPAAALKTSAAHGPV